MQTELVLLAVIGTLLLITFSSCFFTVEQQSKAIIEQFTANANSSGQYVITFTTVKDNSLVSGIEVQ